MGNGPAVYETMEGYKGMIGWIEALHGKFCDTCNRIRLTSIGGSNHVFIMKKQEI